MGCPVLWHNYSHADWDDLCDDSRDIPSDDILKISASAATSEFCVTMLELIYIFVVISIMSSLTHLHGFQLVVLLP